MQHHTNYICLFLIESIFNLIAMADPELKDLLDWIFMILPYYSVQKGFDNLIAIVRENQSCPSSTELRNKECEDAGKCCGM